MPIVDVRVVGERGERDADLAQRLADAAGAALGTEPGRTWLRLAYVDRLDYAENGTQAPWLPVFVELLEREGPAPDVRAGRLRALCEAIASVVGRPADSVHVVLAPPGAGRVAFGGRLVETMPARFATDAKWESVVGYSRAVRAGPHVWVTGTTAYLPEGGRVDADAYAQARQCLANVERALVGLGATLSHVVRTRMFVIDIERDWEAVGRAHAESVGHVRPATTMVEVRKLIEPWMLVEIEADAYLP